MKKLLSLIIVLTLVLTSVFSVSASHNIYRDIPDKTEYMYKYKILDYIGVELLADQMTYKEFCYYSDENSEEPDWVLMVCVILPEPWVCYHGALVGNRVLYTNAGGGLSPFNTGIGVYIPKTDKMIELDNDNLDEIIELCPEFVETIEKNKIGALMGDFYEDNEINILDATSIQRELADLHLGNGTSYGIMTIRSGSQPFTIADFDRDGEVTVMDATAIQKYVVQ